MKDYDFNSISITVQMKVDILNHVLSNIKDRIYHYSINRSGDDDIRPYDITRMLEHSYHNESNTLEINYGINFGKKNYGNICVDFLAKRTSEYELAYSIQSVTIEFRRETSFFNSESHFISISRPEIKWLCPSLVAEWDIMAKQIYDDMCELQKCTASKNMNGLKEKITGIMTFQDALKSDRKLFDMLTFKRTR